MMLGLTESVEKEIDGTKLTEKGKKFRAKVFGSLLTIYGLGMVLHIEYTQLAGLGLLSVVGSYIYVDQNTDEVEE